MYKKDNYFYLKETNYLFSAFTISLWKIARFKFIYDIRKKEKNSKKSLVKMMLLFCEGTKFHPFFVFKVLYVKFKMFILIT
jgi:hypothetical protein